MEGVPCFWCGIIIPDLVENFGGFIRCTEVGCYYRCIAMYGRFPPPLFPQVSLQDILEAEEEDNKG